LSVWSSGIDDHLTKQSLSVSAIRQSQITFPFPMFWADIDFLRGEAERGNTVAYCEHARRLSRDGDWPEPARSFECATKCAFVTGPYYSEVCLLNGYGVSMNPCEPWKYFALAADQEFAYAQYSYSFCLLNGSGVPMNRCKASPYLKLATDQRFVNAQDSYSVEHKLSIWDVTVYTVPLARTYHCGHEFRVIHSEKLGFNSL
jgi:hypothetical protein